jgi:hypothetical protein
MTSTTDYDVRVCANRCGYDASFQPPEIKRCPNCSAPIVAVPVSLMDEWLALSSGEPDQ